jgi:ABC-type uncharacterized transport system permease subunit
VSATTEKPSAARGSARHRLPRWVTLSAGIVVVIGLLATTSYLTGLPELTASGTARTAVIFALPILLAGLGGLWSERAGVVNIGLEGMMILGTWGAGWAGYQWGPWAAVIGGIVFGALGGLVHALATVTFGVNHIVSGVAINLLGLGVTKFLSTLIFEPISQDPRRSPRLEVFDSIDLKPVTDALGSLENEQRVVVSDVAGLLRGVLLSLSPLVLLAFLLVPLTWWLLWRTRFGLRLRSCGENPVASESLGVNVYLYKYIGVVISGGMAGLGGAALVLNEFQRSYLENQTNGRGYIGLAAMIFGNWRPGGLLGGAALFGYTDGLQQQSGGEPVHALLYGGTIALVLVALWKFYRRSIAGVVAAVAGAVILYGIYYLTDSLPDEITSYAPHIVTLLVLVVASQRLRPPAADGYVYRRGESD